MNFWRGETSKLWNRSEPHSENVIQKNKKYFESGPVDTRSMIERRYGSNSSMGDFCRAYVTLVRRVDIVADDTSNDVTW
jgi:hypothetical protein